MASAFKRGKKLVYRKAVPADVRAALGWEILIPLDDGKTETAAAFEAETRIREARHGKPIDDRDASFIASALLLDRLGRKATEYDFARIMPAKHTQTDMGKVRDWLVRHEKAYLAEDQRDRDMLGPDVTPMPWGSGETATTPKRVGTGKRFSEVSGEYFAAEQRPGNYRRASEQFREQCGDLAVEDYTDEHAWTFRNWLSETKDEKRGELLAGKTKNNKLSAIRSIMKFAVMKRYRKDDPFRDVAWYPKNENRKKNRRLLTKDELEALFVEGHREAGHQYWAPLMCLYSGMRREEAIQLRVIDISDDFGVWHFIIRPGEGQQVKSDEARVVPVHRDLIRLGFIDFVKAAAKSGREWLFDPKPTGNAFGQWWGRYMDDCGVPDPNVDLHAVRGAFITYASQLGVTVDHRMEMVGHARPGVHSTYIYSGAPLVDLRKAINKIEYPISIPKIAAMARAA